MISATICTVLISQASPPFISAWNRPPQLLSWFEQFSLVSQVPYFLLHRNSFLPLINPSWTITLFFLSSLEITIKSRHLTLQSHPFSCSSHSCPRALQSQHSTLLPIHSSSLSHLTSFSSFVFRVPKFDSLLDICLIIFPCSLLLPTHQEHHLGLPIIPQEALHRNRVGAAPVAIL